MPADTDDLLPAERKVVEELGHLPLDFRAMAAVSNLFRASAAIRRHMEAKILADDRLSWTSFVAMWVLWVWGEMESRDLAAAVGISRPTSTGIVTTLEGRGFVRRSKNGRGRPARPGLAHHGREAEDREAVPSVQRRRGRAHDPSGTRAAGAARRTAAFDAPPRRRRVVSLERDPVPRVGTLEATLGAMVRTEPRSAVISRPWKYPNRLSTTSGSSSGIFAEAGVLRRGATCKVRRAPHGDRNMIRPICPPDL